MDVNASTYRAASISALHTNPISHKDVKPYSHSNSNGNTKLAELLGIKADDKQDALQAVKLDPAVLEAQITVNTSQTIEDDVSTYDEVPIQKDEPSKSRASFEKMVSMQEAALLSLTPQQLEYLMKFTESLRKKRLSIQKYLECAFCKNNGESVSWYTAHALKDGRGRVLCPVLRGIRCLRCGATGDRAHTIKYCPENTVYDK